jgi:nucleotide-binding universal stress UspA family protein
MFTRILVGVDEETRGRDAIALARKLGGQGSHFTLAHVYPAVPAATASFDDEHAEDTRRLLASIVQESELDADTRWAGAASVGAGLRSVAEEVLPDLLVVGTTGRSRLVRTLLGNPTTGTMTRAECPVAVAPEGYADKDREIGKIAVAYDGTPLSDGALEFARELATAHGAALSTFEVVGYETSTGLASPRRPHKRSAQTALASGNEADNPNESLVQHLSFGNPVTELASYSETVDVLVAGARGLGRLARLLRPSVTVALTDVIRCPLLVLPTGAEQHAVGASSASGESSV